MSIPKEPRQIMINLMYLVLTALLALNVSNEILNAFKVLAKGIKDSNVSIDQKTKAVYDQIKENEKQAGQEEKVRPYREKADEVVKRADEMMKYLDVWQEKVIAEAGGRNEEHEIARPDNIDATTDLLVEKKGGDEVKKKIMELRQFMLQSVKPQDSGAISPLMPLKITRPPKNDNNPTGDWSTGYFEHMPTIAAIAMFSKFQNDVRSSEALVISKLFDEAHLKELKFDTTAAIAIPTTSYALDGQKVEASILLASFDRKNSPIVTVTAGGGSHKDAVNGIVPWETVASGTGVQTVKGRIELKNGDNTISKDWSFQYMVGSTGGSMQLDKMNVMYIGVDNPVTIAAAGYSIEDVSLDVPGAVVKPDDAAGKGHYNVEPQDKVGDVQASILAHTKDQGNKTVGGLKIRIKRIPDPVASLGGKSGGAFPANQFRVQIAPAAVLDNFEFEARFQVVGFTYSMLPKGKDLQGPYTVYLAGGVRFENSTDILRLQKLARAGDKVFIEDIKVIGPDKQVRKLRGTLLFSLN